MDMTIIKWTVTVLLLLGLVLQSGSAASQEETISEGDLIRIKVYGNSDLTTEARVSGDGKITFPFIGEVIVQDLPISEAEKRIARLLENGYIIKPHVSIFIIEYKKIVFVNGEVRNPGVYKISKGLTVLKATTLAGGLTGKASESRMKIIRKTEKGETTIKARMDDLVMPDDIIMVPESLF